MTVGERIRAARKAKGLTQKALGEACGIAEPTIRRYELGKLNPKYGTLEKIAGTLDITASELMGINIGSTDEIIEKIQYAVKAAEESGLPTDPDASELIKSIPTGKIPRNLAEKLDDLITSSFLDYALEQIGFLTFYPTELKANDKCCITPMPSETIYVVSILHRRLALIELLHQIKTAMNDLFQNAEEILTFEEAVSRGYIRLAPSTNDEKKEETIT